MVAARRGARALLVSLDNLGDLVFAAALVPPLLASGAAARVDVWCKEYAAPLAPLLPGVARAHAADPFWDVAPGRGKGRLAPFVAAAARVRRERYDLALVASPAWRAALACALAGVPRRVGWERPGGRLLLTDRVARADRRRPVLDELARLLPPLGVAAGELVCRLDPAPLAPRIEALRAHTGSVPVAALHPFAGKGRVAGRRDRAVPLPEWLVLARALRGDGLLPLWVGLPGELERLRAEAPDAAGGACLDRLGPGGLEDALAALALSRVFVGHDSGPLHAAVALGVPSVGVFAPGEPLRTAPRGRAPARLVVRAAPGEVRGRDLVEAVAELRAEPGACP